MIRAHSRDASTISSPAARQANQVSTDPSIIDKLKVIWIVMLSAAIIYGGLAWILGPVAAVDPELSRWLVIFGAVFAGIILLAVFLLKQLIAGLTGDNYVSYAVVRWSMVEMIAIFGLVLRIVGSDVLTALAFVALGLAMLATMPPSLNEADELEDLIKH